MRLEAELEVLESSIKSVNKTLKQKDKVIHYFEKANVQVTEKV